MSKYKKQMDKGDIRLAYKGLMEYIQVLRLHFKNRYLIILYPVVFILDIWI
jgi:hypothetical protein